MINKNLSMDDVYPDSVPVKFLNDKHSIDAEKLLNECKIFYKKDDLADLTEEEITNFIWMTAAKMVDDEQRELFDKFGW